MVFYSLCRPQKYFPGQGSLYILNEISQFTGTVPKWNGFLLSVAPNPQLLWLK